MVYSVARQPVGRLVLEKLQDHVLVAGLQPGDRLPTERELAKMFAVSRSTIREILKALELAGVVTRKSSRGTILSPVGPGFLAQLSYGLGPAMQSDYDLLMEARRIVEVAVLPLVIQRATEADFEKMEACLGVMSAKIKSGLDWVQHDVDFHQCILSTAGNKYLEGFGDVIQGLGKFTAFKLGFEKNVERVEKEHEELLQCLRDRDLKRAEEILRVHVRVYPKTSLPETEGLE